MIIDILGNFKNYFGDGRSAHAMLIQDFLDRLHPDMEEDEYLIKGDDIFARVMSYETRKREADAVLEAHKKYIDIQSVLIGEEAVEWFPARWLEPRTPYDEFKDAVFYKRPYKGPARVNIGRGVFALMFPEDAHMSQLAADGKPAVIKKVVIKANADLLRQ